MRLAITGANGFISSHVTRLAIRSSLDVVPFRQSFTSQAHLSLPSNLNWVTSQISSDQLIGCDMFIHLAAHSVAYPFDNIYNCMKVNCLDVLSLFETARQAGVRRFLIAGSCFEYGLSGLDYDFIPTSAALRPTNNYAASKASASIALYQWATEHRICLEIIRLFHVFGEGESNSRFWPSLRNAALSNKDFKMSAGMQIRDFQPVQSVAQLFINRSLQPSFSPFPLIFNASSGSPQTLLSLASYWWSYWNSNSQLLPASVPYRDNEVMRYAPGNNLLLLP